MIDTLPVQPSESSYKVPALISTVGATVAEAAFSFTGMLLLLSASTIALPWHLPIAIASACFAVAIEGNIYSKNIEEALEKRNTRCESLESKNKQFLMPCTELLSVLSAIGAFFCASVTIKSMLAHLGVTISVIPTVFIVIVAALAAIGTGFLIYNTLMTLLTDENLKNEWTKFKKSQLPVKVIGFLFFIALIVLATLSTAGTWWATGFHAFTSWVHPISQTVVWFIGASVSTYIFGYTLFTIKNIAETLVKISQLKVAELKTRLLNHLRQIIQAPYHDLLSQHAKTLSGETTINETTYHCLVLLAKTPVFLLASSINLVFTVWSCLVFIAHCISEGVITDSAIWLSTPVAAVINTIREALTDLNYIDDESEDSTNILSKLLFVTLSPVLLLNCVFYSLASSKTLQETWKMTVNRHWRDNETDLTEISSCEFSMC